MIIANHLTMQFERHTALQDLNCTIPDGIVYGLVGSNGAGKSTLMRLLCGIYRPTQGNVLVDDTPVWNNPAIKQRVLYVPDELYFLPQATMVRMASLYRAAYQRFNNQRFYHLSETFGLDVGAPISTFSKGMKRQVATVLALSAMPDYLLFDETFDGLDPVMRNLVKQVIYADVLERKTTTIITSHSLRELEDTCDQLALLHRGGIVFESDIQNLKTSLFKVQIALDTPTVRSDFPGFDILSFSTVGSVSSFIVRGNRDEVVSLLRQRKPLLLDVLPLNLEEVFVYEMEALGYAFKDILL